MAVDRTQRLSSHYLLGDLLVDETFPELATVLVPNAVQIANLQRLAALLEDIRVQFPGPWRVLSGYRDLTLNEACRKAGLPASIDSLHLSGCAADLMPEDADYDLEAVFEWVRDRARKELAVHEAVYYPLKGFIHFAVEDPTRPGKKRILMRT